MEISNRLSSKINNGIKLIEILFIVELSPTGDFINLGGKEYSIADIATYTWARLHDHHNIDLTNYPAINKWLNNINQRPATKKIFG